MKTLRVNEIELATVDQGSGLPVLLVHGFPLDHTMWSAQIEGLSGRCRVMAPDLRGFGRSHVTAGKVTMEQYAGDLAALLDALNVSEPIVFCGLSMGGYVAWRFWEKYATRVRGLILCDTRAVADAPEAAAGRLATADQVLREGAERLAEAMLPKLFARTTITSRPDLVESVRRLILSASPQGIAAALQGMAGRPDATSLLGRITCPCLVLVGRFDPLSTPQEMRSIADAIPKARFVQIPGAGHLAPVENPGAVSQAMSDFLAELGGQSGI